jgi:hypothetical protein
VGVKIHPFSKTICPTKKPHFPGKLFLILILQLKIHKQETYLNYNSTKIIIKKGVKKKVQA